MEHSAPSLALKKWVSVRHALQVSIVLLKEISNQLVNVLPVISVQLEQSFATSILVQQVLFFLMPRQKILHHALPAFLVTTVLSQD